MFLDKLNIIVWRSLLFIICLLPFLITNRLFFLIDPPIWPDEATFMDMTETYIQTGKITTEIYGKYTFTELKESSIGYPPLYFLILSEWIKLFGDSIESMRSLSLIVSLLCLVIFFLIIKAIFSSLTLSYLGTILLSLNISFARASRLGRMEILTLLFILTTFLLFLISNKYKKHLLYLCTGFTAGFSLLTHPMGLIAPMIVFLGITSSHFNIKAKFLFFSLMFSAMTLTILSWIIFFKINLGAYLQTYLHHGLDKGNKLPYAIFLFQNDFSWSIIFILNILIIFLYALNTRRTTFKISFSFLIILISTVVFSFLGKEGGYLVYFQPFIIIALLFLVSVKDKIKSLFIKTVILSSVFLMIVFHLNVQFFNNDNLEISYNNERSFFRINLNQYNAFTNEILNELPSINDAQSSKQVNILISSLPDPYFRLKNYKHFKLYETGTPGYVMSNESFVKFMDTLDYVVASWIPNQLLVDYINKYKETISIISQDKGFSAVVIKLKDKNNRKI